MVEFNPINNFREPVKLNTEKAKPQQPAPQFTENAPAASTGAVSFTADMSELEIKAEMNKACGLEISKQPETDFAKIDAEFKKDPVAFAAKHAKPEVRHNAEEAGAEFDALATVARTFSPERQQQVIEGFANHNPSPNAFTGEFLELFC